MLVIPDNCSACPFFVYSAVYLSSGRPLDPAGAGWCAFTYGSDTPRTANFSVERADARVPDCPARLYNEGLTEVMRKVEHD